EEPDEAAQAYIDAFTALGIERVEVLNVQSREQANSPETLEVINRADGVMFTGGDQLRLTALLGGTALLARLTERYQQEPVLLAGPAIYAARVAKPASVAMAAARAAAFPAPGPEWPGFRAGPKACG
nr:hypothetical protein [Tanacetum cinerariifolium]